MKATPHELHYSPEAMRDKALLVEHGGWVIDNALAMTTIAAMLRQGADAIERWERLRAFHRAGMSVPPSHNATQWLINKAGRDAHSGSLNEMTRLEHTP